MPSVYLQQCGVPVPVLLTVPLSFSRTVPVHAFSNQVAFRMLSPLQHRSVGQMASGSLGFGSQSN